MSAARKLGGDAALGVPLDHRAGPVAVEHDGKLAVSGGCVGASKGSATCNRPQERCGNSKK